MSKDSDNHNSIRTGSAGGLSFASVLTLIFIVLKLTKVIDWSWFWVLSPTIFSIVLTILIIVLVVIVAVFIGVIKGIIESM